MNDPIGYLYEIGGDIPVYVVDRDLLPTWLAPSGITCDQVAAIYQGGCESGAYMPAVRYYDALRTMDAHGDDVLQYLEDYDSDILPRLVRPGMSWAGIAVAFVATATDIWAFGIADELADALEDYLSPEQEEAGPAGESHRAP